MKKIIVIGCPGSGKSVFSRALHDKTGIPLYHLDMLYWNEDKTTVEKAVFLDRLSEVMSRGSWIIDGNYASTMEKRMRECDMVFFLDYPPDVCLDGVRARMGKERSDMPWIETEDDEKFLDFIRTFSDNVRPEILELFCKYRDKSIITFKDRKEAAEFLERL